MALPLPEFEVKSSAATVDVRVIDTTSWLTELPTSFFFDSPKIVQDGGWERFEAPSYAFLVEHRASGRRILFDLGIRKDFENHPAYPMLQAAGFGKIEVKQNVREILEEHGVDGSSIEAVIWSHYHFDHVGDMTTFDPHTALIVGPGFKDALLPGYPTDPEGKVLEADYTGRELREISFDSPGEGEGQEATSTTTTIGRFPAFDFFGDGSFYLLDSPGHAVGHLCGLARVRSGSGSDSGSRGDSFVLMGGDAVHHSGELRPSPWRPLPQEGIISSSSSSRGSACPGEVFEKLYRDGDASKPFLGLSRAAGSVSTDVEVAEQTVERLREADAHDKVFVIHAHDKDLKEIVDFFPKPVNDFADQGWAQRGRWAFLRDFEQVLLN